MINNNIKDNVILEDLNNIFNNTKNLWEELRERKIFLTGCTGFFGAWILNSFLWANTKLNLGSQAFVLTRNPNIFKNKFPYIASNPAIKLYAGDIRNFKFPKGNFSHIIHGATTSATETFNKQDPLLKYNTIVGGTKHLLDFAVKCNCLKLLYISSAAAYGKQPLEISKMSEDYNGAPKTTDKNFNHSVLGNAKRTSEILTTIYSEKYNIQTMIARCFTFVGPYLPLNIHYAIGNFIRDSLNGGPIKILGDGTPIRSYMYTSDLTIWLWTILFKAQNQELYNVGSEEKISICELAKLIAKITNVKLNIEIEKNKNSKCNDKYIPSTTKALKNLGIQQKINLKTSIKRTLLHIKNNKSLYNFDNL